jgi:drug/metabolite transporter (DMT)-like permease
MPDNRLAVLTLLAAAFFWSTSGVLIKLVSLHPMAIAGWRSLIAGIVIVGLCRRSIKVSWGIAPLMAAGCMGLFCICFVIATKLTTAANAIVLQYAAAAYIAVLAPAMLHEPTRRQDWLLLVLVVAGIGLFFMDDLTTTGFWGILVGLAGSIFWAGAMLFLRKSRASSTAWPIALGNFMAAGICLPVMLRQMPTAADWLGLAGLGVVSLGVGYALFAYGIQRVRALEAVLIPAIEPLINPVWVFLATGEVPGGWACVGGALVLTAVTVRGLTTALAGRGRAVAAQPTARARCRRAPV